MTPEDKIAAAIDRLADAVMESTAKRDVDAFFRTGLLTIIAGSLVMMASCPSAKAALLVSDGDEIASVGTVQIITPHPSWAPALGGTEWISIAQTGRPLSTWLPNGTVVSFSEAFSLDSMPSSAMVTWAADDSASLWLNGHMVAAEAPTAGNGYSVCSDFAPTCRYHTTADILPWLLIGSNVLRFDVAQRGGYSFGLNYAVGLAWLDDPPLPTPEPGTSLMVTAGILAILSFVAVGYRGIRDLQKLERCRHALMYIANCSRDEDSKAVAREALEE